MAWSTPKTWVPSEVPTAALLNAQIRDNLLETMPAKASDEGQYFVGNGVHGITPRTPQAARLATSQSTSSVPYADMATVGPSVTVTHGVFAIVFHSCSMFSNTDNQDSFQSWAMSGSNVRAAGDQTCVRQDGVLANNTWRLGSVDILSTLTPGTTTFTCKYRVNGGTSTFGDRFIGVIPL